MPIQHISSFGGASDHPEALSRWGDTPPTYRVLLWPHRSLPKSGFVFFIGMTSFLLAIPLLPLLGTMALWGVLPFLVLTVSALWFFIMRSYRSGELMEELCLWPDHMSLVRIEPTGRRQDWQANPYWVRVCKHKKPVENYLTLSGGDREVELGAFLSPEERLALKSEIEEELLELAEKR